MRKFVQEFYKQDFRSIDLRKNPEQYQIGVGEMGVLLYEPYKSEILPLWRFSTYASARLSADLIYAMFEAYLAQREFPGADMARKFLQMGFTRSRRYANHKSGKKYDGPVPAALRGRSGSHGRPELPKVPDEEKAACATVFKKRWQEAEKNASYQEQKKLWKSGLHPQQKQLA